MVLFHLQRINFLSRQKGTLQVSDSWCSRTTAPRCALASWHSQFVRKLFVHHLRLHKAGYQQFQKHWLWSFHPCSAYTDGLMVWDSWDRVLIAGCLFIPLPSVPVGTPSRLHMVFFCQGSDGVVHNCNTQNRRWGSSWLQLWIHKRSDRLPRIWRFSIHTDLDSFGNKTIK